MRFRSLQAFHKELFEKRLAVLISVFLVVAGVATLISSHPLSDLSQFNLNRNYFTEPGSQNKSQISSRNSIFFAGELEFEDKRLPRQVSWMGQGEYRHRVDYYEGYVNVEIPSIDFSTREGVLALEDGHTLNFAVLNVPNLSKARTLSITIVASRCRPISYRNLAINNTESFFSVQIPPTVLLANKKSNNSK